MPISFDNSTDIRFSLIHFPSYHSYLYRYNFTSDLDRLSILKLENPFALVENKKENIIPVCHCWACILISTFEDHKNFIKVYDMRYEELSSSAIPPNLKKVFPNMDWTADLKILDLDLISREYTIYPIQILNTSNLQLVKFDVEKSNEEYLVLVCLYSDNKIEFYNLSRKARLTSNNIHFMSNYADMKVMLSYERLQTYRFEMGEYNEEDSYKYLVQALIIGGFSLGMVCFVYKQLKVEQVDSQRECDDLISHEIQIKRSELEKIRDFVIMRQSTKVKIEDSIMENKIQPKIRRNAVADSFNETNLMQPPEHCSFDIGTDEEDFLE